MVDRTNNRCCCGSTCAVRLSLSPRCFSITPPRSHPSQKHQPSTLQMESSVSWAKFGERSIKDYKWNIIQVRPVLLFLILFWGVSVGLCMGVHICPRAHLLLLLRLRKRRAKAHVCGGRALPPSRLTIPPTINQQTNKPNRRRSPRRKGSVFRRWGPCCLRRIPCSGSRRATSK